MMKIVQREVEIEVCDSCTEGEVLRYTSDNRAYMCAFCRKVLCRKCYSTFETFVVCPKCKAEKLIKYNSMSRQLRDIEAYYNEVEARLNEEISRLREQMGDGGGSR